MKIKNDYFRMGSRMCLSLLVLLLAGVVVFATAGKATEGESPVVPARKTVVTAAGATFPLPFYNAVFKAWWEREDSPVTYAGIGSDRGLKSFAARQIDFAGVDVMPAPEEMAKLPAETVVVPTCMGAVVLAYNLPEVPGLKLTGELVADIYLGNILKWNDTRIAALNPGVMLPDKEVYPVFRMDGSGTTYVFADYLSKVSAAWKEQMGRGTTLEFPRGVGATGNPGVAGLVERISGAIGYVGSEYAFAYGIPAAALQNAAGRFVQPSPASITAAAASVDRADGMITDSPEAEAYPISTFSWAMLYREQAYEGRTREEAAATVAVLRWVLGDEAQGMAAAVQFAPLPEAAREYALEELAKVVYNGKPIGK